MTTATLIKEQRNLKKQNIKKVFLFALLIAFAMFLPTIIQDKGYFIYYGDFNVQQISFYQLAHKAVRSGDVFWSWYTDLGANFIGSYSFYLLFSPFFWITLPFPNHWLPYLMAPLLILKIACAATTAFLYLERFVRDKGYAILGGVFYAFSGWMMFNTFFNHFHDVAVFFPLLLLSLEQLVTEDKKLFFCLMVGLNAMVNYWFFVGEAVFVIIYVMIRSYAGGWGITWKKFWRIAGESILGFLLVAVAVLPSVMALAGNPRTGTDRLLEGWGLWIYWHNSSRYGDYPQRNLAILQSLFFPPEIPANPNFLPKHGAQWASLSAWIPMFGLTGVFAYFYQKREQSDWLKKILAFSFVCAMIPVLNSLFVLFNASYYARWFYMPILLMSLATAIALEQSQLADTGFRKGLKWVFIITTVFAVATGLTPQQVDGKWSIGLANEPLLVGVWYLIVLLGLGIVALCIYRYRDHPFFQRIVAGGLAFICVGFGVVYFAVGRATYPRSEKMINVALGNRGKFHLPEEPFARSDIYDDMDNMMMFWERPTIQTFHSIVPTPLMEFYPLMGVDRGEASRPKEDVYALRSLFSVRWLFIDENKEEQEPMPGYKLYDTQNGYHIYENQAYIPMGFPLEYTITPEQLEQVPKASRPNLLLRALVLEPEDQEQYGEILSPLPPAGYKNLTEAAYLEDAHMRQKETTTEFTIHNKGFTATSNFSQDRVVFFSVPYEPGWSATVNGESVPITQADIAFMAISVPAGPAEISFTYFPPGLKLGAGISATVAIVLLLIWIMNRNNQKKIKETVSLEQAFLEGETVTLSWEEYVSLFHPLERKELLRRALQKEEDQDIVKRIESPYDTD